MYLVYEKILVVRSSS